MEYDGAWTLSLPSDKVDEAKDWPRPFLSNGKLVIRPGMESFLDLPKTRIVIPEATLGSGDISFQPNAVQGFDFGRIHFFHREPATIPLGLSAAEREELRNKRVRQHLKSAELHMDTGTFTSTYELRRGEDDDADGSEEEGELAATVTRTVYPSRSNQFVAVQSFKVVVEEGSLEDACFFHEIVAPPQAGGNVTFSSPVIFSDGTSTILFTGDAPSALGGKGLSVASAYAWTNDSTSFSSEFEVLGYNVPSANGRRPLAYNKVDMIAPQDTSGSYEFNFQILTSMMSGYDTNNPTQDTRRALVRAVSKSAPVATLRSDHVKAWDELWKADVSINPKLGISSAESERIHRVKRHLRYAMYMVHSCTRGKEEEAGARSVSELRSSTSGVVDVSGTLVSQSDTWLLPTMMLIQPRAGRALLEHRHSALDAAKEHAALQGRSGAYYPYAEASGETFLMFSASTRIHVFNTALLAANAWNYYRATKDVEWLRETGYPVISAAADFVRSCFSKDADGRFALIESVGLDGTRTAHNSFAVNSCMLALRAAIEGAYALGSPVKRAWSEVMSAVKTIYLVHNTTNTDLKWVYQKHLDDPYLSSFDPEDTSSLQEDGDGNSPWVALADPLFIATPMQAQVSHPNGKNLKEAVKNNLAFYEPRLWLNASG